MPSLLSYSKVKTMKWILSIAVVLTVSSSFGQSYNATSLGSGLYKVGFTSSIEFDPGRPPIIEQEAGYRNGRAVHISTWYPAVVSSSEVPMNFKEYVDDISRMVNPEPVSAKSTSESIRLMKFFLWQLNGDTSVLNTHLANLLKSPVAAYKKPPPVQAKFPVVVYPESSYQNNILCEYLASHGYIVVSVSRHGTFDVNFEWQTVRGIESLVQDCQFALGVTKTKFGLTEPDVVVMGVGMNASAGLAWMMRSNDVDALVSLEGGILTIYEYNLIQKSPWFDKAKAIKPMLVMHSPHEAVNAALIDHYKYADRHVVSFPRLTEFYYLNYGVWEASMPGILGPAPGDTKQSNEWMMRYTHNFLDHYLKQKESGKIFFSQTPLQNGVAPGLAEHMFKPRYEIPPSESDLEALKQISGFNAMLAEVTKHQQKDPQAFSFDTFIAIGQKLIGAKEFEHGTRWATLFNQSYPEAASAFTIAGRCYLELGQKEKAITNYRTALKMLPSDPNFDPGQKDQLKGQIEKRLEQLKS